MWAKYIIFVSFCTASFSKQKPQDDDADWWKAATVYQVYPRSFRDTNNDGNGDLKGVIEKLPYLDSTGIDAIWLSPIMKSPQVDQGYDISDYLSIDPMYGTMDDLKDLIKSAHDLNIKVILDFVPNHTSDQHEWFIASENGNEKYKDYYMWVNGTKDKTPNNWISLFKNSAWEWSEKRQQWYLHQFVIQQPDLNYRNPEVREEMKNTLKFYLDLGIDGFRCDAVMTLVEVEDLLDEPRSYNPNATEIDDSYLNHIYTQNLPETYDIIYEWREFVEAYYKEHGGSTRILMTEVYANLSDTLLYYGSKDGKRLGAHFSFNFFLITGLNQSTSNAKNVESIIQEWLDNIPEKFTSNWVLGNHDQRRYPTRLGVENKDGFNILKALLPGVSVVYNGEEFGQEDGEVTFEEGKDPSARNKSYFEKVSRDFERTPLQWDNSENAGFNAGHKPWLPVSKKYVDTNLASQLDSEELSNYQIFQKINLKRRDDTVKHGTTEILSTSEDVITLKRTLSEKSVAVAFKLGWNNIEEENVTISNTACNIATVFLTSTNSHYQVGSTVNPQSLRLKQHEAVVLDISC